MSKSSIDDGVLLEILEQETEALQLRGQLVLTDLGFVTTPIPPALIPIGSTKAPVFNSQGLYVGAIAEAKARAPRHIYQLADTAWGSHFEKQQTRTGCGIASFVNLANMGLLPLDARIFENAKVKENSYEKWLRKGAMTPYEDPDAFDPLEKEKLDGEQLLYHNKIHVGGMTSSSSSSGSESENKGSRASLTKNEYSEPQVIALLDRAELLPRVFEYDGVTLDELRLLFESMLLDPPAGASKMFSVEAVRVCPADRVDPERCRLLAKVSIFQNQIRIPRDIHCIS